MFYKRGNLCDLHAHYAASKRQILKTKCTFSDGEHFVFFLEQIVFLKGGKISFDRMPFPDRVSIPLKATANKTFSHRSSLSFWSIVKQSTI